MTLLTSAGLLYYGEVGWVCAAAHRAVSEVRIQRQALSAVANKTAEGIDWM